MPYLRHLLIASTVALCATPPFAAAESCAPDVKWQHEHAAAKADTITTDVKGTRATRIEVCQDAGEATPTVTLGVSLEGVREPRPLEPGHCTSKLAKWAVIRSKGTVADSGPARVSGVYRVCKE